MLTLDWMFTTASWLISLQNTHPILFCNYWLINEKYAAKLLDKKITNTTALMISRN